MILRLLSHRCAETASSSLATSHFSKFIIMDKKCIIYLKDTRLKLHTDATRDKKRKEIFIHIFIITNITFPLISLNLKSLKKL